MLDHRVHDGGGAQELALERPAIHLELHRLQKVAFRDRRDRARNRLSRPQKIIDQAVDGPFHLAPGAIGGGEAHTLSGPPLPADDLPDLLELLRHSLVGGDNLVEDVGDLAGETHMPSGKTGREVAGPHRLQGDQKIIQVQRVHGLGSGLEDVRPFLRKGVSARA
ncbi:hypothetical protein [Sabulicella rubraurantiaca]|uniref:hypothetical protein n=1 Tax=Sabulicella rubraurantiaca TaxID=2811429 RepID=UPI001A96CB4B|nr:hypothetical protein [Sabulicella rubraurantiaca]